MKKVVENIHKKLNDFMLVIKGAYGMARNVRLAWLIHFIWYRYQYNLKALWCGMQMNQQGQGNFWSFRRNIHRLEKGLLHKQQKPVFAEDYISETVGYLAQILSSPNSNQNTIMWGEAVMSQYFKTCQHTQRVSEAYARYLNLKPRNNQPTWYPYPAKDRPTLSVDYEALYQLALRRRSIRFYLDKVVNYEVVERAMRVAALSPSACNRQSFKFLFYNDKAIVREISQMPGGFAGYEVPSIIAVIGSYRGYFDERDVNVPIIDASLAVMSFLLALETLGLSSVCMNWPALPDRDEAMHSLIHLEDDEIVIMLIGIGYPDPDGKVAYSAKRDVCSLIHCNERLSKTSKPRL